MLGFDVRHGRYHVHRAILEGITLTIIVTLQRWLLSSDEAFEGLVISGGGSGSRLIMQIFTDVFGLPDLTTDCAQCRRARRGDLRRRGPRPVPHLGHRHRRDGSMAASGTARPVC